MTSEVRCSVCGAQFKVGDHVYKRLGHNVPWLTLKERLRGEALELVDSMSVKGVSSMGTYHRMLVVSETLRAITDQMQQAAKQQGVKP